MEDIDRANELRVCEEVDKICDKCPIRCVHSGSKLEQDNLVKKK